MDAAVAAAIAAADAQADSDDDDRVRVPVPEVMFGTVASASGGALSVSVRGSTATGVRRTTACSSAKAGDRVVLVRTGAQIVAIGILQ